MKKFIKNNIKVVIAFVLGIAVCGISVYAISASEVTYNNTTVSSALDELYTKRPILNASSISTDSQYKNDRAGTYSVSLNLTRGKYLCFYVYNTTGTSPTANVYQTQVITATTEGTGCDEIVNLDGSAKTIGGPTQLSSSYLSYYRYQAEFVCTLNSDKTITVSGDNGANGYGLPADSYISCVGIE